MNRWIDGARVAVLSAVVVAMTVAMTLAARAQDADLQAEGAAAVQAWVDAVVSGDKDTVAGILAPEYQIVRDNGVVYDRDGYLASDLPKMESPLHVDELFATGAGDVMVVRYVIVGDLAVDGDQMASKSPRLTTFRRVGDRWLVSSHANFARISQ